MRTRIAISVMFAAGLLVLLAGCGGSASGNPATGKLKPVDVRPALRALPYEIVVKRVQGPGRNLASFRGRAHGSHKTTVEFSIGIGDPPRVLSVRGVGTQNVAWEEASGFVYNDNAWPTEFKTSAQWRRAAKMSVAIWESLCEAATGEPCPV
jgi:hypothetical protein